MKYIVAVYSPRTDDVESGKLYVTLHEHEPVQSVMEELTSYSPMEHMDKDILDDVAVSISGMPVGKKWGYHVPADEYYHSDYVFCVLRIE